MTPRLVLLGGGEHARVVAEAVRASGAWHLVGFVDPLPREDTTERLGLPRLGDDDALVRLHETFGVLGFATPGDAGPRRGTVARAAAHLTGWATVVHPRAWIAPDARLGPGSVVMAGALVQAGARIGAHSVVNTGAVVEHDVHLDSYVQVASGALIGGGALLGSGAFVGLGAIVRDHVSVGAGAVVAMGAVVISDVPPRTVVKGVPAR